MAESIVYDVVVKLLEYVGKGAVKEIAPYFGGKRKLKDLEHTMVMIQARLLDAERRGEGGSEDVVKNWLKRLKRVLYRLEDLFEEVAIADQEQEQISGGNKLIKPVRLLFSSSNPLKINKKVAKEAKAIMGELKVVTSLMDSLKFREFPIEEYRVGNNVNDSNRETHSFVVEEEVIGRDEDRTKIVQMLLDSDHSQENVSVIPIVGIGGLGKTTLAQLVFNDKDVRKHFELRSWACISDISSLQELAGKILKSITDDDYRQLTMEQIQSRLHRGVSGKRYLLVLDDIWDEDRKRWLDLKSLLSGGKQGSKIIVTSRSRVVAQNMGTVEPYELGGLPEDKSWDLFRSLAFKAGHEVGNPNLTHIGRDIVKKCANVPLAIKTIACLLYSTDTEIEWEAFKDKELKMIEQNENSILLTLKLSYDRLPPQLRQCFAYCSLFPKDHAFLKQDLIYLWMAQGFLRSTDRQCPEDVGHGYFMQLRRRCFFQDDISDRNGEIFSYKMHDLVHDLAQLVAGGETLLVDGPIQRTDDFICHMSFSAGSSVEAPSRMFAAKHMRSLLLLSNNIRLNFGELFSNIRCLRALDLGTSDCKSLPDSLGELKHLRYLRLGRALESIPECIARLQNLHTLDLQNCGGLRELPRGFVKLINLRHLHFRAGHKMVDMPAGFGLLTSLRALNEFVVGENCGLDTLISLNHLAGLLRIRFCQRHHGKSALSEATSGILKDTKLTYLRLKWLSWREEDELALRCLQPPLSLKSLGVCQWQGVKFPDWGMDAFPCLLPNLVTIEIENCSRCKYLPPLSHLPHLRSLRLGGLYALEYIEIGRDNTEASSGTDAYFPSLETLQLFGLLALKQWSRAEEVDHQLQLPRQFFPHLFYLSMETICPLLKSMPLAPRLESLEIRNVQGKLVKHLLCSEQESVLESESSLSTLRSIKIIFISGLESLSIYLCSLESLEIQGCEDLINLTARSPTSLRRLIIKQCSKLRNISDALRHLIVLEELIIRDCEELYLGDNMDDDDVDNARLASTSTAWQALKSLRFLTLKRIPKLESQSLRGLACLTTLWDLSLSQLYNLEALPESIGCLTQLQKLYIDSCQELTALPESFGNLTLINTLTIKECPTLTALPESFRNLTSLQSLEILECPELKRRCEQPDGQDWPLIQHIPLVYLT